MAKLSAAAPLDELEQRIGFRVNDRARLERALTHASHRSARGATSYERLEFLGDRVLGLVISERLFEMFPKANEGELSLKLNQLVSAEACAEIADLVGLTNFIRHGGGDLKRMAAENTCNAATESTCAVSQRPTTETPAVVDQPDGYHRRSVEKATRRAKPDASEAPAKNGVTR